MDGWIELSGCGCGKWKVEGGAVPDLTYIQIIPSLPNTFGDTRIQIRDLLLIAE